MSKPFDSIDSACITRLGYEHNGCDWVEKARAPITVHLESSDEEAQMDIPPPSPTTPYSPPPASTTIAGSSFDCPKWYHDLSQCIDTLNLDLRALSEE